MHIPIQLKNISFSLDHKICFDNFSENIHYGDRIGIIGDNGSGKSSLINILIEEIPKNINFAYVEQIINDHSTLSGGERFNKALSQELARKPEILLLDEPTNHLDVKNRNSLYKMLNSYQHTLIIVSHDEKLLKSLHIIWHIYNGKINIFNGNYSDYLREFNNQKEKLLKAKAKLEEEKKLVHQKLMKEQERAKKRKSYGEKKYGNDTIALRSAQGRGELTRNKNKKDIASNKEEILEKLSDLYFVENIKPKFYLKNSDIINKNIVFFNGVNIGYEKDVLKNINFDIKSSDRIAVIGDNGSGKSTLFKAILGDKNICVTGDFNIINNQDIGYLDQHYNNLNLDKTPFISMQELTDWPIAQIRQHLNDFLFRKNEEVNAKIINLSGGEKARLSLALIAAKTPKLLLLDEITNNIDMTTKSHLITVLENYPGAFVIISHDEEFLKSININKTYEIKKGALICAF